MGAQVDNLVAFAAHEAALQKSKNTKDEIRTGGKFVSASRYPTQHPSILPYHLDSLTRHSPVYTSKALQYGAEHAETEEESRRTDAKDHETHQFPQ